MAMTPERRARIVLPDVLEELRAATSGMRPGTANSDINTFTLPVEITYGLAYRLEREIKRLRAELAAK
jgi:hypothetical protein